MFLITRFPTTRPRYTSRHRRRLAGTAAACTALMIAALAASAPALAAGGGHGQGAPGAGDTTTPIKHVIVVYQENVSFDHYFGTYPNATNTDGTRFVPAPGTPSVNGLGTDLLSNNPNGMNPARLTPAQALT